MEVSEWFASRDAAYEEFDQIERNPDSAQHEVDEAWCRFHFVRTWLRRWKLGESDEWLAEFEIVRKERIGSTIKRLPRRQPELGDE